MQTLYIVVENKQGYEPDNMWDHTHFIQKKHISYHLSKEGADNGVNQLINNRVAEIEGKRKKQSMKLDKLWDGMIRNARDNKITLYISDPITNILQEVKCNKFEVVIENLNP